jgi:hypothetical protein
MTHFIQYKSEAINDLKEINGWYQGISKQISTQFQKSIELA